MNEDIFNTSIRRFLKTLGVTAQREIEKAVREALADGRLKGNEKLPATATVAIDIALANRQPSEADRGTTVHFEDAVVAARVSPHGQ